MTPSEIVLGAPGCGKTEYMLGLLETELKGGTSSRRIGYFSFTRKAAQEAIERALKLPGLGLKRKELPYFRTLHSLAFNALGLSKSAVFDGDKLMDFGREMNLKVTNTHWSFDEDLPRFGYQEGDRILHIDNLARLRGIPLRVQYDKDTDNLDRNLVERVSESLVNYKDAYGLADFTDMLVRFADEDWHDSLDVVFVDEAQDLSPAQWRVVARAARGVRRLVVAGDDDQAIYRWAGADVDHFVALAGAKVTVLEQSWRVPHAVQAVALEVAGRISNRRPKAWLPLPDAPGRVDRAATFATADIDHNQPTLILARNSCFLGDVRTELRRRGIIYGYRGRTSVPQKLVNAIMWWEYLRKDRTITVAEAEKVYALLPVGVAYQREHRKLPRWPDREAPVSMADLKAEGGLLTDAVWYEAMTGIPVEQIDYIRAALANGQELTAEPKVKLSTIHGIKGGEAEHVVLLPDLAPRTKKEFDRNPDDEHRVLYVAVTRAKARLTIVEPTKPHSSYRI